MKITIEDREKLRLIVSYAQDIQTNLTDGYNGVHADFDRVEHQAFRIASLIREVKQSSGIQHSVLIGAVDGGLA